MNHSGWTLVKLALRLLVLVVAVACLVHIMPYWVLACIAAWVLVSVPVGVLMGHCALSEGRHWPRSDQ